MDLASALAHAIDVQHVALTEIRALDQSLARRAKSAMSDPPSLFAEASCEAQNVENIVSTTIRATSSQDPGFRQQGQEPVVATSR